MRLLLAAIAAAAVLPAAALAHHGWSGQESDKVTALEGTIQSVSYRDPHGEIVLLSGGQKWDVTLAPIFRMQARGVTEAMLQPGRKVRVEGRRNLDPKRQEMKAENIRIDGKVTSLR
jgi:hypothetical protein